MRGHRAKGGDRLKIKNFGRTLFMVINKNIINHMINNQNKAIIQNYKSMLRGGRLCKKNL